MLIAREMKRKAGTLVALLCRNIVLPIPTATVTLGEISMSMIQALAIALGLGGVTALLMQFSPPKTRCTAERAGEQDYFVRKGFGQHSSNALQDIQPPKRKLLFTITKHH